MTPVSQTGQVDSDTDIAPQNSYRPFSLVLPNRETALVASIPDAPMASVTPETTGVENDNDVTETREIDVSTPTPGSPRVTTPARC